MKRKVLTEVVSTHNWDTKPKVWADWMLITCLATIFDLFITCFLLTNLSPFLLPFFPFNSLSLIFSKLASVRRRLSSNSSSSNSSCPYPSPSMLELVDGVAFIQHPRNCNRPLFVIIGKWVTGICGFLSNGFLILLIEEGKELKGTQLHMLKILLQVQRLKLYLPCCIDVHFVFYFWC